MTDYEYVTDYIGYDKGVRALKQMWRMLSAKYNANPETRHYADEDFARMTAKFLDRTGFHAWAVR